MRYSPIEDYGDYGGTASQPPGLGASSTPADYASQSAAAPPPWHGDAGSHPLEIWQQPRGASPPTNGGMVPPGGAPLPQWHQQMHAAHSDLRAVGAVAVGPQSGYPTGGQHVPLAVAAQQASAGHYGHQLAMSHAGYPAHGHQLPPQSAYAMQTQPGQVPGQMQTYARQHEDFMHPAQQPAQPPPYGAAQLQPRPALAQQPGYGAPPQHNGWQPDFGGPGAYAQHHFRAPSVPAGYIAALQRPPVLPPPQDQPFAPGGFTNQQHPHPHWEAPGPAAPSAGYPAPQLNGYGKQDVLVVAFHCAGSASLIGELLQQLCFTTRHVVWQHVWHIVKVTISVTVESWLTSSSAQCCRLSAHGVLTGTTLAGRGWRGCAAAIASRG